MRPAEFWCLAPGEIWWIIDAKSGAARPTVDYDELGEMLDQAIAEEQMQKQE